MSESSSDLFLPELRQATREFTQGKEFQEFAKLANENPYEFPAGFLKSCVEPGYLSMDIPSKYGGSELVPLQQAVVLEEFNRGHSGLGLALLVNNSLVEKPFDWANEEQKERFLPGMARGEIFGCFGLTEPNRGSDATGLETKAVRDEARKGWVINGSKRFITSANGADFCILAARTGTPESKGRGITAFIADLHTEGVTVPKPYEKVGQKGATLCEVNFQDAFIPDQDVLGKVNNGWRTVFAGTLAHSRVQIASQAVGMAQHAVDLAEKYGQTRPLRGHFLTEEKGWANNLAVLKRQVELSRYLTQKAAERETSGDEKFYIWAAVAKLVAGESLGRICLDSMLLHGGDGIMKDFDILQLTLDSLPIHIYEGSSHVQYYDILQKYFSHKRLSKLFMHGASVIMPVEELQPLDQLKEEISRWRIKKRSKP